MRLLIVAAPMVSKGGVYSWLRSTTPILREDAWVVGVLWAARVDVEAPESDWEEQCAENGGRLARIRDLRRATEGAIKTFQPDRILSVLPQADLACSRAVRRDTSWTAMIHGQPYPSVGEASAIERLGWRMALRSAYRRANHVIAVSDALGLQMEEEFSIRGAKTVHNGVQMPPSRELRPRHGRTVGFLGRLSSEKAPDFFLEAIRGVDCEALIYGAGPLEDKLQKTALPYPNIQLQGWADRDLALERIDLLAMTSRREALGLSCIEAGARGIPVVARDVGGVGEILSHDPELRRHCLVTASASPAEFGAKISGLLDDAPLREALGKALRQTVEKRFAISDQGRLLGRLLRENS